MAQTTHLASFGPVIAIAATYVTYLIGPRRDASRASAAAAAAGRMLHVDGW